MFGAYSTDPFPHGGHMRLNNWTYCRVGHHSPTGPGGRGRGCVMLADGLQENTERQRSAASSDPSAEPDVHEPRPDVRTITGLSNIIPHPPLTTNYLPLSDIIL